MASHMSMRIVALRLIVVAAGAGGYWLSRPETTPPIVGVVLATEVRIAPEVDGQLTPKQPSNAQGAAIPCRHQPR